MVLQLRILLLCTLCIVISGFMVSYKAFQIHQDQLLSQRSEQSEGVSRLVGQNIAQKIQQMEASVSYLDKSTVETLKRFGARYFAYAYQQQGQWAFKWKILGSLAKDEILGEIASLPYSRWKLTRRYWRRAKNKAGQQDLILISPAALAKSLQLKEGFLVFGMSGAFFKFSQPSNSDESYAFLNSEMKEVFGALPNGAGVPSIDPADFIDPNEDSASLIRRDEDGGAAIATAVFSPMTQLWTVRSEALPLGGFIASRFFSYFLLTSLLSLLLMMIVLGRSSVSKLSRVERLLWPLLRPIFRWAVFSSPKGHQEANEDGGGATIEGLTVEAHGEACDEVSEEVKGEASKVKKAVLTAPEDGENGGEVSTSTGVKRIEISEQDADVSFDDVVAQFQMKDFSFTETPSAEMDQIPAASSPRGEVSGEDVPLREDLSPVPIEKEEEVQISTDDKGLFEFNSGDFKIKIRSPKKRGDNVSG